MTSSATLRKPGRPREEAVDQRIIAATFRLMAQHGYARMSLDAVAVEAGVTKPTIYRRYRSKEQLAVATLATYRERTLPPLTGDTRADLIAHLRHFRRGAARPYGMAMIGTVLAEEHDTPDLLANFREYVVQPRRQTFRAIFDAARKRSELRDDADSELAINMLVGAYYAQYLADTPFTDDWEIEMVDTVLRSICANA